MKPIFIRNSAIPRLVSWFFPVRGITFGPLIFLRDEGDARIDNHESIHVAQYSELWIVGFLFLYLYDYLVGLLAYRDTKVAYLQIRFEQEARSGELDLEYLSKRPPHAWRKFRVRGR